MLCPIQNFMEGEVFYLTLLKNHVRKVQKFSFGFHHSSGARNGLIMDPYYFLISTLYVFCIYLWAGSPLVLFINAVNPFSLLHIPLYGILTVLLLLALNTHLRQSPAWRYFLVGLIAFSIAVLDEVQQSLIPYRVGSFTDVLLDMTGVFFAMLVFGQFSFFRGLRRLRKFRRVPLPYYSR